jgi:hypothetical protein
MFIYLIVNHETGKYYVGQHKGNNLKKYLQQKFHHAQKGISSRSRLYNSMRKHPLPSSWSIHALRADIQTKSELDETERDFIKFLRATDPEYGYNICRRGEGFTGPHGPAARAKVTEALKQRWAQPNFREHWSEIMKGHPTSQETIDKIKAARVLQDEAPRAEGCRKYAAEHPKEMSARLSHEAHILGGRAGTREAKQRAAKISIERNSRRKAQHVRWHVNRGLINPECLLCKPSL